MNSVRETPSKILVKAGEWKLGYEDLFNEPLPFELVPVMLIETHPFYNASSVSNDLAVLVLEKEFKLDQHVDTICLNQGPITTGRRCISTGWGIDVISSKIFLLFFVQCSTLLI